MLRLGCKLPAPPKAINRQSTLLPAVSCCWVAPPLEDTKQAFKYFSECMHTYMHHVIGFGECVALL